MDKRAPFHSDPLWPVLPQPVSKASAARQASSGASSGSSTGSGRGAGPDTELSPDMARRLDLTVVDRPVFAMPFPLSEDPPIARRRLSPMGWMAWGVTCVAAGVWGAWVYMPQRETWLQTQQQLQTALANATALQAQLHHEQAARHQLELTQESLTQQLAQKEQDLDAMQHAQEAFNQNLAAEVEEGSISIQPGPGELVVNVVDRILFNSGETHISKQGRALLRRVGTILLKAPDNRVEIRGHTDSIPIAGVLAKRFPTNWELSTQRATGVVRFLIEQAHVPAARLVAAGFAQYRPLASNQSPVGRRRNRRIEIVLLATPRLPGAPR